MALFVTRRDEGYRSRVHRPLATPEALAREPAPFSLLSDEVQPLPGRFAVGYRSNMSECPFPKHDSVVTLWLARHKMSVDAVQYDGLNLCAWRYDGSTPFIMLQVTDEVMSHHSPEELDAALESLKVAEILKRDPSQIARLVEAGTDAIHLLLVPRRQNSA
ncbi:MAG TPA: hypothetical protein VGJ18_07420 [Gemmatimonadaceae bacterium]